MTTKPKILIVEDEVAIQDLLKKRLAKSYEISCAGTQESALSSLDDGSYDLLLLDLKLPRHASDMNASPDVGIAILAKVREKKMRRRGSTSPLPVVVMTAFGKSKLLSAEFLQHRGACDYIQKPFGDGKALKKKIEIALCDEGSFTGPARSTTKVVQLQFNTADKYVLVETFKYDGAAYELLLALRDVFLADHHALRAHDAYRRVPSKELAATIKVEDATVRRRVGDFREDVAKKFREELRRILDDNDIIENKRDWNGYRLNPLVVKLVAWEQEMTAAPRRP